MKTLTRFVVVIFASALLAIPLLGGPETMPSSSSYKETKNVVAPVVPECNWQGFYIGLHGGGQWGESTTVDLDAYNSVTGDHADYDQSGLVVGGQAGYNFQWRWLVLGVEGDFGYMDLDGSAVMPASAHFFNSDTIVSTDSDFYGTFRGRLGAAFNKWLFYGTGGGIAVNYETRVLDVTTTSPGAAVIDAHETDFNWGWTVGGGLEYMFIRCRG